MLLHHLKSANVIFKNFYLLDLKHNSIDDEGVIVLTECLPELFPNLKSLHVRHQLGGVDLRGNPVSKELILMCNEQLKVYIILLTL